MQNNSMTFDTTDEAIAHGLEAMAKDASILRALVVPANGDSRIKAEASTLVIQARDLLPPHWRVVPKRTPNDTNFAQNGLLATGDNGTP